MPVDDNEIDTKIAALKAKSDSLEQQMGQCREVASRLIRIKQIDARDNENKPIKKLPNDRDTGKEITPGRRQEIYTTAMADADTVLAS